MSVTLNNLLAYGCANMPEADGVTVGGAVDFTKRISFLDLAASGTLDLVSSSASDTAVLCAIAYRDSFGVYKTPVAITLTGTTVLSGTFGGATVQRIESAVITGGSIGGLSNPGGSAAVGDIAILAHTRTVSGSTAQAGSASTSGATPPILHLKSGDGASVGAMTLAGLGAVVRITGGTGSGQLRTISAKYVASGAYGGAALGADYVTVNRDWGTVPDATSTYDIAYGVLFDILPVPVTAITRIFATAAADIPGGSTKIFYEKFFLYNNNTTTTLTNATAQIASDTPALAAGNLLDLAVCSALNDNATAANRQTLPTNQGGGALTFVTQPATVSLPNNLPGGTVGTAGNAQGCWARLTVLAGAAAYAGVADLQTQGQST